ncbi:hypothetical protein CCACVL1_03064 [Corchorus capsularis]|uniref:Uncharacterized protein n=1 Tax=Corchorus capsularis TaxID=210143 RepID=A0A1R3K381_COCAP|nr:hypothetical protein CCACVL1_03064 [Corchorus capsularis]
MNIQTAKYGTDRRYVSPIGEDKAFSSITGPDRQASQSPNSLAETEDGLRIARSPGPVQSDRRMYIRRKGTKEILNKEKRANPVFKHLRMTSYHYANQGFRRTKGI